MNAEVNVTYAVYLLASKRSGTLYLGVTRDLGRRIWQHKTKALPGFTACYNVDRLVWYEIYENIEEAISREKSMKKWRRAWKVALIEKMNPSWADLYDQLSV